MYVLMQFFNYFTFQINIYVSRYQKNDVLIFRWKKFKVKFLAQSLSFVIGESRNKYHLNAIILCDRQKINK